MKKIKFILFLVLLLAFFTGSVQAFQTEEVRLNVRRNFGFSSGSQIRGTFAMDIIGNVPVQSVTYLIDGKIIAESKSQPFGITFQTTSYSVGWHDLSAEVITSDNRKLTTPVRRFEFVSTEVEGQAVTNILIPLLGVVAVVMIIGVASQVFFIKKKGLDKLPLGAKRSYGILGGVICPKCKRPYSRHWWGLNMVMGKLDRCDFCGKWSITHRASSQELDAAEIAELKNTQREIPIAGKDEKEKMKEMLDDSKYIE